VNFHFTTCVWGDWHRKIFVEIMLGTLLSSENLPVFTKFNKVVYRISTTQKDREWMDEQPNIQKLKQFVTLEYINTPGEDYPTIQYHVEWYHMAIQEAKNANAICAFFPPDVVWSNCSLANLNRIMQKGYLAIAAPYLRVISETLIPELLNKIEITKDALEISPAQLIQLGIRHIHPLTASVLNRCEHGRPSLEMLWPVPEGGLLLRHFVRELFAFDPNKIEISHLWYAQGGCKENEIYLVQDSDEIMMLSLAPLRKDVNLFLPHHEVNPDDLAKMSRHPLNDTIYNPFFLSKPVRLRLNKGSEEIWRRVEEESTHTVERAIFFRSSMLIWNEIKKFDCAIAAKIMAAFVHCSGITKEWKTASPLIIYVPIDTAFDCELKKQWEILLQPRLEKELEIFVLSHLAKLDGEFLIENKTNDFQQESKFQVVYEVKVEEHVLRFIDQALVPIPKIKSKKILHHTFIQKLKNTFQLNLRKISFFNYKNIDSELTEKRSAEKINLLGAQAHETLLQTQIMKYFVAEMNLSKNDLCFFDYVGKTLENKKTAEFYYQAAIALKPNFLEPKYSLIKWYLLENKKTEKSKIKKILKEALRLKAHPDGSSVAFLEANVHWELALIEALTGEISVAHLHFNLALKKLNSFGPYHVECAKFFHKNGFFEEAYTQYEKSMQYAHRYAPEFLPPHKPEDLLSELENLKTDEFEKVLINQ
jgi:hypothetical protein